MRNPTIFALEIRSLARDNPHLDPFARRPHFFVRIHGTVDWSQLACVFRTGEAAILSSVSGRNREKWTRREPTKQRNIASGLSAPPAA